MDMTSGVAIGYSASQKERKPVNQVNFSENCNDLLKKFTLLQNSIYPLSFDTSYKCFHLRRIGI